MKRILPIVLAMSCLVTGLIVWAQDIDQSDPRIEELERQIQDYWRAFNSATNRTEQKRLEGLIEKAEKEQQDLILRGRAEVLAAREQSFMSRLRSSRKHALLESVRAVDPDTEASTARVDELSEQIREARKDLAEAQTRLAETPEDDLAYDDLEMEVEIKREALLALIIARDAADLQAQVGAEAVRIEELVREAPPTTQPTIRTLLNKKKYIEDETLQRFDMKTIVEDIQHQLEGLREAVGFTEERLEIIDDIETGLARRQKRDLVQEKISFQRQQIAEAQRRLQLAEQAHDFYGKEIAYLQGEYERLRGQFLRRLLYPAMTIAAILVLQFILNRLILPIFFKRDNLFIARRLVGYFVLLLIILVLAVFFLEDLKAVATVLSIAGAAVVIALQDLCSAFAGWFVIIASGKVQVGNRVEINGQKGDVIDIQLLRTTMVEINNWLGVDEPTGRIIIIPNSFIFKSDVVNYSHVHPYIWGRLDIIVTFETPASEAQQVLLDILTEVTKPEFEAARHAPAHMEDRYGVADSRYEPKIYSVIADSGVNFSMLYVCHYRRLAGMRNKLNEKIIEAFEANPRLEFAYPTERHIPTAEAQGFHVALDAPKKS